MKAKITVTDDRGKTFSGEVELAPAGRLSGTPPPLRTSPQSSKKTSQTGIDFTLSNRAFAKRHVTKRTSGPRKFVILLAYIAKGSTGSQVQADRITKEWAKVRGPMGGKYQRVFATRAKDEGWIDSPRQGVFILLPSWKEAFTK
jgi:hypothetical protein